MYLEQESASQIKLRAQRLEVSIENTFYYHRK